MSGFGSGVSFLGSSAACHWAAGYRVIHPCVKSDKESQQQKRTETLWQP